MRDRDQPSAAPGGPPASPAAADLARPEPRAFRAIAAALGARFEGDLEPGPASDAHGPELVDAVLAETGNPRPTRGPDARHAPDGDPATQAAVLDQVPFPLLVVSGETVLHANPAALRVFGFSDLGQIGGAGGLAALFAEARDRDMRPGAASVMMRDAAARTFPATVRMARIPWRTGRGLLLAIDAPDAGAARSLPAPADEVSDPRVPRDDVEAAAEKIRGYADLMLAERFGPLGRARCRKYADAIIATAREISLRTER